jgi:1,4-alpha-glucan branching enzyme
MHTWESQFKIGLKDRYSAKKMAKPVQFMVCAPEASRVCVSGDFNHWSATSHPMSRLPDGGWRVEVPLHHGHHQYLFVIDGVPTLDPKAQGVARNHKGERVSLIAVS